MTGRADPGALRLTNKLRTTVNVVANRSLSNMMASFRVSDGSLDVLGLAL